MCVLANSVCEGEINGETLCGYDDELRIFDTIVTIYTEDGDSQGNRDTHPLIVNFYG